MTEPQFDKLVLTIGRGDTMEKLFRKNNLNLGHLMSVARLDEAKQRFRRIKPGDVFEITHDDGQLISMYSKLDLTSALRIEKQDSGFAARLIDRPVEYRKRHAYGVITNSLFESAAEAGLSDKVIMNVAGIFAWDVDFVLDIRRGDNYYIQYEEVWQDGEFVMDGEIIAAEFNNNGRSIRAIRFKDDDDRTDYFTPKGDSVRKAFLRNPVDFTRISSNFNPNRRHPILNTIRAHRGVDYAAPRGTPIKASGDGKVIFRGNKAGYGKAIILAARRQHHDPVCTHVGFRRQGSSRLTRAPGADDRLRWRHRSRDSEPSALRISRQRRAPQPAHGQIARCRAHREKISRALSRIGATHRSGTGSLQEHEARVDQFRQSVARDDRKIPGLDFRNKHGRH